MKLKMKELIDLKHFGKNGFLNIKKDYKMNIQKVFRIFPQNNLTQKDKIV